MFNKFIKATTEYTDIGKNVPAPYIRKGFNLDFVPDNAKLCVCTPGFYELWVNGKNITKGALAPYISNPDEMVCYDEYEISSHLVKGKNAIGLILGNGFANQAINLWQFSKAEFRAPLCVSVSMNASGEGEKFKLESDESFKCHFSPVIYDMYRYGTHYDARLEIDGWSEAWFDDSSWENSMIADRPKGEIVPFNSNPITPQYEIAPSSIAFQKDFCYLKTSYHKGEDIPFTHVDEGYLYDFSKTVAGVCRLKIKGEAGQKITIRHCERLSPEGNFNVNSIYTFNDDYKDYIHLFQTDVYILKGGEEEIWLPPFTYHGFRYAFVEGITEAQATKELLTAVVLNSDIRQIGGFECSDDIINKLYNMTILADVSNFHYFPTDCPQREKNGWTGDASASAQQYPYFFDCGKSLNFWLKSMAYTQRDGMLPCIVPTSGWGYTWGNGPAWDSASVNIPYYLYKYTMDKSYISDNADMIINYLRYISQRRDSNGLIAVGLGDWCQPGSDNVNISAPLRLTDTAMVYDMCVKSAYMFGEVNRIDDKKYALDLAFELRRDIREHLIDFSTMTAEGSCQTSQAFLLSLGIFEKDEEEKAYKRLLDFIFEKDNHVFCGVIGLRHIFEVLCKGGDAELALQMITRPDEPSYGAMIERGATALCEALEENGVQESGNHHFFGDIIRVFASCIAGLEINPEMTDANSVLISPIFTQKLTSAKAFRLCPEGRVSTEWKREGDKVFVTVEISGGVQGRFVYGNIDEKLFEGINTFCIENK